MIVNVMTNNYQERHEDLQQRVKELEAELKIVLMDKEDFEEQLREANEKIEKLEGDLKKSRVEAKGLLAEQSKKVKKVSE